MWNQGCKSLVRSLHHARVVDEDAPSASPTVVVLLSGVKGSEGGGGGLNRSIF